VATSNQRRDAARRKLEAELAQRQVQQSHRRSRMLTFSIAGSVIAAILVVILVAVLVSSGDDKKTASASPSPSSSTSPTSSASTPTPTAGPPGSCDFSGDGSQPSKPVKAPPATGNPTSGTANVTFKTTQGDIVVQVDRAKAPCTVESFLSLVTQKYYDSTPCHRLVPDNIFVLQCGDPTGKGAGGPGYAIPDEATGNEQYPAGTLAMARTGQPRGGGSQFFFVFKDAPTLQQSLGKLQYTVFGKVTSGLDVLLKVAAGGLAADGTAPKLPVTIESATIS